MEIITPLQSGVRTKLFVTDTKPIAELPFGTQIPDGTILKNNNNNIAFDVSGLYLLDVTLGDSWYEGSIVVSK